MIIKKGYSKEEYPYTKESIICNHNKLDIFLEIWNDGYIEILDAKEDVLIGLTDTESGYACFLPYYGSV